MDAVETYLRDVVRYVGTVELELEWIAQDYMRFRREYPALPEISEKRLSQCLVAHGCARDVRNRRRKGQDGRRVTVFELRKPRGLQ